MLSVESTLIKNYVNILFKLSGALIKKRIYAELYAFNYFINKNICLLYYFCSNVVAIDNKLYLLNILNEKIFFLNFVFNFIKLLIINSNINIMSQVLNLYAKMLLDSDKVEFVDVFVTRGLTIKEKQLIIMFLTKMLKKCVKINVFYVNNIQGGMLFKFKNFTFLDFTLESIMNIDNHRFMQ